MILDLFAGPGGWDVGLGALGHRGPIVGLEWDRYACETRAAAGHATVRADVAGYPTAPFAGRVEGLIASPPCPDWSAAGSRAGRDGATGGLVDEVPRWVEATRPTWFACEQVPPALPVWEEFARSLRALGYRTWCGILNAADFGVPQTRRRAFLLGHVGRPAHPPEPTHARYPAASLFGGPRLPWVTMAQALGWSPIVDRRQGGAPEVDGSQSPCPTITAGALGESTWTVRTGNNSMRASRDPDDMEPYERGVDEPSPTVTTKVGRWKAGPEGAHADPPMRWKGRELVPGRHGIDPHRRPYDPETDQAPTLAFGHDSCNWAWRRPATTLCGSNPGVMSPEGGGPEVPMSARGYFPWARPATTIVGSHGKGKVAPPGHHGTSTYEGDDVVRIEVWEAAVLQGFPPDYPWRGPRSRQYQQVGNAVPPPMAAAVLAGLVG